MEITYIIATIVQSIAISLGVGCSTVAITQFFSAISDGQIDPSERKLMGVVYTILRIAMGLILITSLVQGALLFSLMNTEYFTPFTIGLWIVILVLFVNAVAMTKHWIPATFGPGIQAGSWYTLGLMFALISVGLSGFSELEFALSYLGMLVIFVAIVNGVMSHLKKKKA